MKILIKSLLLFCLSQTCLADNNSYGTLMAPPQKPFTACPGISPCNVANPTQFNPPQSKNKNY